MINSMKRKFISLAVCITMMLSLMNFVIAVSADDYFSGSGTEDDPFLISEPADITQLATLTNNSSDKPTAAAYAGKYYKLTRDIDMTDVSYVPISRATSQYIALASSFTGTLDGGGHIISNISFGNLATYGNTYGIIGYLGAGGTVKNLGVENMTVNGGSSQRLCIGGIAGTLNASITIENCYVRRMNVTVAATQPTFVGGVAGFTVGNAGTIRNCYSAELTYTLGNANNSGGILGASGNSGYKAINCYTIHSKTQGTSTAANGSMQETNCYTAANVATATAEGLGAAFKENLTEKNDGYPVLSWESTEGYGPKVIKDPNFSGSGTEEAPFLISKPSDLTRLATLTNTPASAATYADKYYKLTSNINMSGVSYVPISRATNMNLPQGAAFTGTLDGGGHIISNISFGNLATYGNTYGIIGYLGAGGTVKSLGIENMTVNGGNSQRLCIGGIAGTLNSSITIENCYVRGVNVTTTSTEPTYVGGIAGRAMGTSGTVTNSYSSGLTYTLTNQSFSGGIIGGCGSTGYAATNCYTTNSRIQGSTTASNSYMQTTNCHAGVKAETALSPKTLGDAFEEDSGSKEENSLINDGLPILTWEYDVAHTTVVAFTVKANNIDVGGREDVRINDVFLLTFAEPMKADTASKISVLKGEDAIDSNGYSIEAISSSEYKITILNPEYGNRYGIFVSKRAQSVGLDESGKTKKADEKSVIFRIESKPKNVTVSGVKVNDDESWTPDFTGGTAVSVETNVTNTSNEATQTVTLLVTVFSDGIMKYAAFDTVAVGSGSEKLQVNFSMPVGLNLSNSKMYVMVWDSIEKMNAMRHEQIFTSN